MLNSCTVKTPSEAQLENNIKEAKQLNKLIVVAGCVSQVLFFLPFECNLDDHLLALFSGFLKALFF